MGLDYPGGPVLSKMAQQGVEGRFVFPRPMTDRPGLDFSFSGLKPLPLIPFVKTMIQSKLEQILRVLFEDAVVDTLAIKCRRALEQTGFLNA